MYTTHATFWGKFGISYGVFQATSNGSGVEIPEI